MADNSHSKALVVLSGGQDSTTCLYLAKEKFDEVHALTFDYGQLHSRELLAAKKIGELAGVTSHEFVDIPDILVSSSPLLDKTKKVGQYESADVLPGGVEDTFVPGRNVLFLVLAANRAARLKTTDIFIGVCEEDFGGYWDCRGLFLDAMSKALGQGFGGVDQLFTIHAPLLNLTKSSSVHLADSLEGCMAAIAYSHTCYKGDEVPCGSCHACLLRSRGFSEAGLADPLITRVEAYMGPIGGQ